MVRGSPGGVSGKRGARGRGFEAGSPQAGSSTWIVRTGGISIVGRMCTPLKDRLGAVSAPPEESLREAKPLRSGSNVRQWLKSLPSFIPKVTSTGYTAATCEHADQRRLDREVKAAI